MVRVSRLSRISKAALVALGIGVMVAPLRVSSSDDPYHAAWTRVGLGWDPLLSRITNTGCAQDRNRFEACLLAMAALGAGHEPPLLLRPAPVGPFGAAALEVTTRGPEPTFSLETRARRERTLVRAWTDSPSEGVNFETLFATLRQRLGPEHHAALAARGTAAYLRRAVDPHTAIAPYDAVAAAYNHAARGGPIDSFLQGSRRRDRTINARIVFERGVSLVHVEIDHLDDVACFEVSSALSTLLERGATGVLLDLRGNLGGVSREAACIADLFLPRGTPIVRMEALVEDFETKELRAQSGVIVDVPTVVLIDSWSASGAEVIAAALQANRRALVVGTRSFGKGTYQEASSWSEQRGVVYYRTVARLVVPPAAEFQMHGVLPDLATSGVDPAVSGEVFREENAYVNPIPARYPAVARQDVSGVGPCVADASGTASDRVLATGQRTLWCALSGTLPGP